MLGGIGCRVIPAVQENTACPFEIQRNAFNGLIKMNLKRPVNDRAHRVTSQHHIRIPCGFICVFVHSRDEGHRVQGLHFVQDDRIPGGIAASPAEIKLSSGKNAVLGIFPVLRGGHCVAGKGETVSAAADPAF